MNTYILTEVRHYTPTHLIAQLEHGDLWNWYGGRATSFEEAVEKHAHDLNFDADGGQTSWTILAMDTTNLPLLTDGQPCTRDAIVKKFVVTVDYEPIFGIKEQIL